jgi:hypothetical protein
MEPNNSIDCTEELVNPHGPAPEETRSAMDLMNVKYEDMSENERKYFISALKMRNKELDGIAQRAFEENRKLQLARNKDLRIMEDTLTFIKTEVGQCLGSVSLAIKNIEREVQKHGN